MGRRQGILLAAAGGALALPAAAQGAGWVPPGPVAAGAAGTPSVAAADGGGLVLGWGVAPDDGTPAAFGVGRPPGGPVTGPASISVAGREAGAPVVAANAAGAAAGATITEQGSGRLEVVRGNVVQGFTAFEVVPANVAGGDPSAPAIALAPDGRIYIALVDGDEQQELRVITRDPASGAWSLVGTPAAGAAVSEVRIAARPDGTAAVAWVQESPVTNGVRTQVRLGTATATGIAENLLLGTGDAIGDNELGVAVAGVGVDVDGAGRRVVAFTSTLNADPSGSPDDPSDDVSTTSVRTWLEGTQGVAAAAGADVPVVAAGAGGAVVAWTGDAGEVPVVHAPLDGGFGAPRLALPAATDPNAVDLDVLPDGTAVVAAAGSVQAAGAAAAPGQPFPAPTPLGGPSDAVDVSADALGDAAVALGTEDGQVLLGAFDAAPPLVVLREPGGGVAGRPVAFGATVGDVWSPVSALTWAFGDGAEAPGPDASHAYAEPGTYTARLTATDALGNTTAPTTQVVVVPEGQEPPPPPPPPAPPPAPPIAAAAPAPAADVLGPAVSGLSASRTVFRPRGAKAAARLKRLGVGSGLRFTLDEAGAVSVLVTRLAYRPGGRSRCFVRGAPPAGRRPRVGTVGRLSYDGVQGLNRVAFDGRVAGRALSRGRYALRVTARDAAGNVGAPATVRVTVC